MNDKLRCAFTGHRHIQSALDKGLENRVIDIIEDLACEGVEEFYTGGALGFDTLAALCVLRLRERLGIKLCVCVPFSRQDERYEKEDKDIYRSIIAAADEVITVRQGYSKNVFYERNRYMVDNCDVCVAFLEKDMGGTAYTVKYAASKGKRIINLAEEL